MPNKWPTTPLLILSVCPLTSMQSAVQEPASSAAIQRFEAGSSLASEIFRKLAEQEHIVIGVSGTLVGSDHTLISVNMAHTNVKDVLDRITAKDPRYTWRDLPDRTIEISIGQHPLELLKIPVHNWTLDHPPRYDVTQKIAAIPEIKKWLQQHSCNLGEVIVIISPSSNTRGLRLDFTLNVSGQPLRSILNQIAARTKTYFWSAIKFSEKPCYINLLP